MGARFSLLEVKGKKNSINYIFQFKTSSPFTLQVCYHWIYAWWWGWIQWGRGPGLLCWWLRKKVLLHFNNYFFQICVLAACSKPTYNLPCVTHTWNFLYIIVKEYLNLLRSYGTLKKKYYHVILVFQWPAGARPQKEKECCWRSV